jgi:hypothetical protein
MASVSGAPAFPVIAPLLHRHSISYIDIVSFPVGSVKKNAKFTKIFVDNSYKL